ncbi:MAG TPA: TM2 domain-containing protein [Bacilli bacterium]|nr:MAG: hypothetical protein BWY97_00032 [Tenericutes bacterium ADurb.BinA124]HNZ50310.1 TM2 domain-containing protein [Bacilli bacterium]HOH18632.1 TM2 domain-containing protein [Bacilli bacterium]HPN61587.1 TM2 domain-containing protein [Bacilli bacterium]HPX84531.1 TM2 domain-containing protein [Bacilli bacterium]
MEYVKAFNGLSKLAKFLLTLFLDPIIAGIYRLIKGRYLIGAIWIFTLGLFGIGWIIDLVTVVLDNKYSFLV